MDSLILKVKTTLADYEMVERGDRVLLGVSGGPDSVALLQSLLELRDELGIDLVMAHLNHSARGDESDRDARFVKELGEAFQIETLIEKKDVAAHQATAKSSFQETARNLRLEFLEKAMGQLGADKIALGHTSDDQAETVLMNLLRGSGLKGIGGMSPVRHPYIRPLFDCSRFEIINFLNHREIEYCQDSSNEKTDYLRNRIRLELIPYLKKEYNPRIIENLFDASGIFRADNDYLESSVDHEFERVVLKSENTGAVNLGIEPFSVLPLALKRRLVRKGLEKVKGDLRRLTSFHIQEVLRLFEKSQKGKKIDLPGDLEVLCRGDRVEFKRIHESDSCILSGEDSANSDWMRSLVIPGETPIERACLTLKAEIMSSTESGYSAASTDQAFLDFDKTGGNIQVRFFQEGDRLKPLGMKGTKKVKSLFIDEKVPQENRSTIPILTTGDNDIIWVYGVRIADAYRVTSDTTRVLFIKGLT